MCGSTRKYEGRHILACAVTNIRRASPSPVYGRPMNGNHKPRLAAQVGQNQLARGRSFQPPVACPEDDHVSEIIGTSVVGLEAGVAFTFVSHHLFCARRHRSLALSPTFYSYLKKANSATSKPFERQLSSCDSLLQPSTCHFA